MARANAHSAAVHSAWRISRTPLMPCQSSIHKRATVYLPMVRHSSPSHPPLPSPPNEASAPFPPIHHLLCTRTRPRLSRSQASTRDTACPEFVEEQPARHLSDRFHQRHLAGSYTVPSSRFSVRLIIYWPSVEAADGGQ